MPPESNDPRAFPLVTAVACYALAFLVPAWPWLSGGVTIPWDAKSQFFPNLSFLARSLGEGQLPFWTPHVYAGWPQIADPQSLIFSPFHFVLALLDATPGFRAADFVVFALLFLGGLGIILIFRDRGWHIAGALVAALAFAFGGSNASRLQHIGQIESLAWLPLALWLLMRALEGSAPRASWKWGVLAGIAAGLIAIGRDQVALLSLYVLTGFVIWHWLDGEGRLARLRMSITPLASGAVAGALVAAVPVVLTALLAADSNRPEVGIEIAAGGSLHPANLLTLVFVDLFGAADPKVPFWGAPSFPWHERFGSTELFHAQNIGQLYGGAMIVVAVVGVGFLRGVLWAREVRFFTVAMLAVLLYALGKYTPAFQVLYEILPGVALYRRPADATFVFGALFSIAGGYCIHRVLTNLTWTRWHSLVAVGLAAVIALAAVMLGFAVGQQRAAVMPLIFSAATVGLAVSLLARASTLAGRGVFPVALVFAAFTVGDLAWNNAPHESNALPSSHYDALRSDTGNETVALLKARLAATSAPDRRGRVELIGVGYHWPNIGMIHGFDHLFGHNPLRLSDFARATNASDTVALPEQREFSPLLPSYRSPLENLFGVRFIASGMPVEQIDRSLKPGDLIQIARTKDAYVYENPRALPRVLLAGNWVIADFERLLAGAGWPDGWTETTVFIERAPRPAFPPSAGKTGSARIVSTRNTEVVVEVETPVSTVLVFNDVWHPWWRASLDGAPVEILKANVLFRGVAVPPGKHVVRFTFEPFRGAAVQLWEKLSARWR